MDPKTPPEAREDEATAFLLDLAEQFHLVQAPADVIEAILRQVARSYGAHGDFMLFQSYAASDLRFKASQRVAFRRIEFDPHWRMARAQELTLLAISIADGKVGIREAHRELRRIAGAPPLYPRWLVVLAYGIYGTAVAARIGGTGLEMAVGGIAGVTSGATHLGKIRYRQVDLQKSFLAGVVGTITVLGLSLILPPFNLAMGLFGGVVLLVPTMLLTIGTHEVATEALESGALRLAYGFLRFAMVGAGIAGVLKVWVLILGEPSSTQVTPLSAWRVVPLMLVGGTALIVCLQARWRDAHWIIGAVILAFSAQELTKHIFGKEGSPMLAALVLGLAANLISRRFTHLPGMIVAPGLLQLVPGFLGTEAVFFLLRGQPGGEQTLFKVMLIALQLVTGLLMASVLVRPNTAGIDTRSFGAQGAPKK